jgi:hypothetical protein
MARMFVFMELVYHGVFRAYPHALGGAQSAEQSRVSRSGFSDDDALREAKDAFLEAIGRDDLHRNTVAMSGTWVRNYERKKIYLAERECPSF